MLDFLFPSTESAHTAEIGTIILRILLAVVAGLAVAVSYRLSHGYEKKNDNRIMFATLVLLCIFISMVSMVIGNSVAMAFSLVGALSIVRFRTVVEDTRDTAFVIFSVITGMAMGAGYFAVPLVGIPIAAAVSIGLNRWSHTEHPTVRMGNSMELSLRIGVGRDMSTAIESMFQTYTLKKQFVATTTTKQGSAIDIVYRVQLKPEIDPVTMVTSINMIEGVQAVELKPFHKES